MLISSKLPIGYCCSATKSGIWSGINVGQLPPMPMPSANQNWTWMWPLCHSCLRCALWCVHIFLQLFQGCGTFMPKLWSNVGQIQTRLWKLIHQWKIFLEFYDLKLLINNYVLLYLKLILLIKYDYLMFFYTFLHRNCNLK